MRLTWQELLTIERNIMVEFFIVLSVVCLIGCSWLLKDIKRLQNQTKENLAKSLKGWEDFNQEMQTFWRDMEEAKNAKKD